MNSEKLTIYYSNDFHSHVPESINLLATLSSLKGSDNTIIVDTGDFSEGAPFFNVFQGAPERRLLRQIYDVVAPGNHGIDDLIQLHRSGFPVVNANILAEGKPLFQPTIVINRAGRNVGFIGVMSLEAFFSIEAQKREHLSIIEPYAAIKQYLASLRDQVDLLILLSHSGMEYDIAIAKQCMGIDIILSGHCHSDKNTVHVGSTLITKAPELGRGYGRIHVLSDNQIQNQILLCDDEPEAVQIPDAVLFLQSNLNTYRQVLSECVFHIDAEFAAQYHSRRLLAEYIVENIYYDFQPDICIINYSCLRTILNSGDVTLEDLYALLPFDTELVVFQSQYNEVMSALANVPAHIKEFLCIKQRSDIDTSTVTLVTTSYLADGMFGGIPQDKKRQSARLRRYLIDYFNQDRKNNDSYCR